MRLALNPRARRLLRRVPHTTAYTALELVLLSLLAIQAARLVWTLVTPVDPLGEWRSQATRPALAASAALFGSFDPFFRLAGGGPAVVTSLSLKLFGVRENRATGRGSAIIETPDGQQKSVAVGEEIMPGVTLAAVAFDSITVSRGGTMEQLFLDQSQPATVLAPGLDGRPTAPSGLSSGMMRGGALADAAQGVAVVPPPIIAPPPGSLSDIQVEPRLEGGRVTGVMVNPQGNEDAFIASGLQRGDVIVSVNGQRITSADQAQSLVRQLGGAAQANVTVERNGQPVTLTVRGRP